MAKKRTKKKSTRTPKAEPAMRISKNRRAIIEELAELLAAISPATTRGNGFCVRKIAVDHGDKSLWKDKSNKRKSIAHYLEEVFRR